MRIDVSKNNISYVVKKGDIIVDTNDKLHRCKYTRGSDYIIVESDNKYGDHLTRHQVKAIVPKDEFETMMYYVCGNEKADKISKLNYEFYHTKRVDGKLYEIKLAEDDDYYYLKLFVDGKWVKTIWNTDLYKANDTMYEYLRNEFKVVMI